MLINGLVELSAHLGAGDTVDSIARRVYKDTECGIALRYLDGPPEGPRIELSSIVEGSDAEVAPVALPFPFSVDEWDEVIASIEFQADQLWHAQWREDNPNDLTANDR